MRTKFRKDTKKCPRCGCVCLNFQKKCEECGLVFERLKEATNKEAKKQFFKKDKSVVMVKELPSDIQRWKLILLCLFLGPFGVHNLYVGRYYKGTFMLVVGLISLILASLNNVPDFYDVFMSYFFVFPALLGIFWIVDLFNICFGFYKVPVALERK